MCLARGASASTRLITLASVLNRKCGSIWPCSRRSWASLARMRSRMARWRSEKTTWNSRLIISETTTSETTAPDVIADSSVMPPNRIHMPMGQPTAVPSSGMPLKNRVRRQPASRGRKAVPNSAKVALNRPWIAKVMMAATR